MEINGIIINNILIIIIIIIIIVIFSFIIVMNIIIIVRWWTGKKILYWNAGSIKHRHLKIIAWKKRIYHIMCNVTWRKWEQNYSGEEWYIKLKRRRWRPFQIIFEIGWSNRLKLVNIFSVDSVIFLYHCQESCLNPLCSILLDVDCTWGWYLRFWFEWSVYRMFFFIWSRLFIKFVG